METAIIVFLWIVGALCLFVIAFLTYDLIVTAQDRKAQKAAQNGEAGRPAAAEGASESASGSGGKRAKKQRGKK